VAEGTRTPNSQIHSPGSAGPNCKAANELGNVGGMKGAIPEAVGENLHRIDPDLAALVDAWPTLPAALKAGIVAMVETAGGSTK